ncbi:hypothetical protein D918_04511 [Trichuris suis]|nr:hypothetical protein D918_04511 [Trichuris suis]
MFSTLLRVTVLSEQSSIAERANGDMFKELCRRFQLTRRYKIAQVHSKQRADLEFLLLVVCASSVKKNDGQT